MQNQMQMSAAKTILTLQGAGIMLRLTLLTECWKDDANLAEQAGRQCWPNANACAWPSRAPGALSKAGGVTCRE